MSMRHLLSATAVAAAICTSPSFAGVLTFQFSGSVTSIIHDDSSNAFSAAFHVGDAVTGSWSFDTGATANPLLSNVQYYDATFEVTINGNAYSGGAQYRIFDHGPGGDGFSIINESGTYTGTSIGTLVPRTFFIQYLDMPASTLSGFGLITDPVSLIPLANLNYAPHGFRLDNPSDSNDYGGLYFKIDSVNAVPEPSTYAMMGLGLAALAVAARRRRSVAATEA